MERIIIPAAFVGGVVVGKNWDKIVKVTKPYLRKGIKESQKIALKGMHAIQKTVPGVIKGTGDFLNAQGKKFSKVIAGAPSIVKAHHKAAPKKRKVRLATA